MYRAQDIASIDFVEDARAAKAAEPALVAAGAAGEDAPGGAAVKRYGRKDGDAADGDAVPAFLRFKGVVYNRGAMAEAGAQVSGGPGTLAGTEAINLHVGGDGQQYLCVVRAGGHSYVQRFLAREGFGNVHLPWCFFRPEVRDAEAPPLDPNDIDYVGIRYEPRIGMAGAVEVSERGRGTVVDGVSVHAMSPGVMGWLGLAHSKGRRTGSDSTCTSPASRCPPRGRRRTLSSCRARGAGRWVRLGWLGLACAHVPQLGGVSTRVCAQAACMACFALFCALATTEGCGVGLLWGWVDSSVTTAPCRSTCLRRTSRRRSGAGQRERHAPAPRGWATPSSGELEGWHISTVPCSAALPCIIFTVRLVSVLDI